MKNIKVGGKDFQSIKVWKPDGFHDVIGRIMTADGLKDFYRPINFDIKNRMVLQTTKTLSSSAINAGATLIPVRNATGFFVGGEMTITDGINSEDVKLVNRNLIPNSGSPFNGNYAYNPAIETIDGKECLAYHKADNIIALEGYDHPLVVGETYTFSFYAKATSEISIGRVYLNPSNNGFLSDVLISTEWKRYHFTFVFNGGSYQTHVIYPHFYPETNNGDGTYETFYITDWKLEQGNQVTTWSRAPEDVYSGDVDNVLSVTPTRNEYKSNSIVARSTVVITDKLTFGTRATYTIS